MLQVDGAVWTVPLMILVGLVKLETTAFVCGISLHDKSVPEKRYSHRILITRAHLILFALSSPFGKLLFLPPSSGT